MTHNAAPITCKSNRRLCWAIAAVCTVPGGAHPSYAAGYSTRDNDFYSAWDAIARDRDRFTEWMREHVLEGDKVPA